METILEIPGSQDQYIRANRQYEMWLTTAAGQIEVFALTFPEVTFVDEETRAGELTELRKNRIQKVE